jgi:antitoxin MazE
MRTRVQRWGNSLAVRVPKAHAAEIGLSDGSPVELKVKRGVLVVEPSASAPRLGDLLRGIRETNLHKGVHIGPAAGNEAW